MGCMNCSRVLMYQVCSYADENPSFNRVDQLLSKSNPVLVYHVYLRDSFNIS